MIQESGGLEQEVLKRVDLVAQKFSEIAPEAWEILVRQQIIEGWMAVAWMAVPLIWLAASLWRGRQLNWKTNYHSFWEVSVGISAAILIGSVVVLVSTGIPHLLNPEFYAIQEMLP